jgi:hypothetical protein
MVSPTSRCQKNKAEVDQWNQPTNMRVVWQLFFLTFAAWHFIQLMTKYLIEQAQSETQLRDKFI